MVKPFFITESCDQPNIKYCVRSADIIEETFAPLVEEIRRKRTALDKTIVFCCTCDECSRMYLFLRNNLGEEGVQPIRAPDLSRLVELFTASTLKCVKDIVLTTFTNPQGIMRVQLWLLAWGWTVLM